MLQNSVTATRRIDLLNLNQLLNHRDAETQRTASQIAGASHPQWHIFALEEAFADCVCIQVIDDAKSKRRAKKVSNITKKIIEAYEKKGTPE